ncbi:2600_t:CDS:2, partial [Dentiscutata erythropus]
MSWARSLTPFQFNAKVQSTQSVESFNAIIKKALNSASTLCDIKQTINKRHDDESQYCKLTDLKDQHITIAKAAINIALEVNKDAELKKYDDDTEAKNATSIEDNNSIQNTSEIILLQEHLLNQVTSPNVTKIRSAPYKKRVKGVMKISKGKKVVNETTNIIQATNINYEKVISKQQRKCLLYKNS